MYIYISEICIPIISTCQEHVVVASNRLTNKTAIYIRNIYVKQQQIWANDR